MRERATAAGAYHDQVPTVACVLKSFLRSSETLADAIATAGDVRHVHAHVCHSATMVAWLAAVIDGNEVIDRPRAVAAGAWP
jgi:hypothetical protein